MTMIKQQILETAAAQAEVRNRIGLSQLGKCPRQVWYAHNQFPEDQRDLDSFVTFAIGNEMEAWIVRMLRAAGYTVEHTGDDQLEVEYRGIKGHPDGVIMVKGRRFVLECKTMSDYGYRLVEKDGLENANPDYWLQCQAYAVALGADGVLFLALNKEARKSEGDRLYSPTTVTKIYEEWLIINQPKLDDAVDRVLAVIGDKEPPARPYSKREKFPCGYCSYLSHCWGKQNDPKDV